MVSSIADEILALVDILGTHYAEVAFKEFEAARVSAPIICQKLLGIEKGDWDREIRSYQPHFVDIVEKIWTGQLFSAIRKSC
jgi:hypothetical protein